MVHFIAQEVIKLPTTIGEKVMPNICLVHNNWYLQEIE